MGARVAYLQLTKAEMPLIAQKFTLKQIACVRKDNNELV